MINSVVLVGRTTKDIELMSTKNGKSVANFTIAVDRGFGENKTTDFIDCTVWDNTAVYASKYVKKGNEVVVFGTLVTDTYEKNGEKRKNVKVSVSDIHSFKQKQKNTNDIEIEVKQNYDVELIPEYEDDLPF